MAFLWPVPSFELRAYTILRRPESLERIPPQGLDPSAIAPAVVIATSTLGRFSANERVHGFVAVLLAANLLLGFGANFFGVGD